MCNIHVLWPHFELLLKKCFNLQPEDDSLRERGISKIAREIGEYTQSWFKYCTSTSPFPFGGTFHALANHTKTLPNTTIYILIWRLCFPFPWPFPRLMSNHTLPHPPITCNNGFPLCPVMFVIPKYCPIASYFRTSTYLPFPFGWLFHCLTYHFVASQHDCYILNIVCTTLIMITVLTQYSADVC